MCRDGDSFCGKKFIFFFAFLFSDRYERSFIGWLEHEIQRLGAKINGTGFQTKIKSKNGRSLWKTENLLLQRDGWHYKRSKYGRVRRSEFDDTKSNISIIRKFDHCFDYRCFPIVRSTTLTTKLLPITFNMPIQTEIQWVSTDSLSKDPFHTHWRIPERIKILELFI